MNKSQLKAARRLELTKDISVTDRQMEMSRSIHVSMALHRLREVLISWYEEVQ